MGKDQGHLYILFSLLLITRDPESLHYHRYHHSSNSPQPQTYCQLRILDVVLCARFFHSLLYSGNGTTVLFETILVSQRVGSRSRVNWSGLDFFNILYLLRWFRKPSLFGVLGLVFVTNTGIVDA